MNSTTDALTRWGALRYRNYRLFLLGQSVSLLGTWMQTVALTEVVWRETHSPIWTGIVNFAGLIPQTLLLPIAGVWVDRFNRYRLIMVTQTLAMLQAVLLGVLATFGWLHVPEICGLAVFLGCITAFDLPARQAFLPAMLDDRADLPNAIALNASLFHGTRFLGPAIAGAAFVVFPQGTDVAMCFWLNGLSFLAVLIAFLFMRVPPQPRLASHLPVWRGVAEAWSFVFGPSRLGSVLVLVAWMGLLAMPYSVVMRPFSAYHLDDQGGEVYGFLMASSGLGSLTGALLLAARRRTGNLRKRIVWSGLAVAALLVLFGASISPLAAFPLAACVGAAMLVTMVSCNTLVQTTLPDALRGRVMSLYNFAFQGMLPFGNLVIAALADRFNVTVALWSCALASVLGAAMFATTLRRNPA